MKSLFVYILFFIYCTNAAFAQSNVPISVSPVLVPPYSASLSDYCAVGSQKLMVNIRVNDLTIANHPIKLRIKLTTAGITIENPPTINTLPLFLDGGGTYLLFGEDLKDYFNINNLIFKGYDKQAYLRTGQLPEGFYRFTVEVLDYRTNKRISNQGQVSAWIALGKPPVLTNPKQDATMGQFKGIPLNFSWQSSNVGSPASAGHIQYQFELWEMRISGMNPNTVVASTPVFYEQAVSTTLHSVYPSTLLMEPGMQYAWRVTAFDASGFSSFEQNGHSEVRTFTYKSKCDSVTNYTGVARSTMGVFSWDVQSNHTSFNTEIENLTSGYHRESETYDNLLEFRELKRENTYRVRVQGVCDGDANSTSDYSHWETITIPAAKPLIDTAACPECGCGVVLPDRELTNYELSTNLAPGDTIETRNGGTHLIIKTIDERSDDTYKGHLLLLVEAWGNIKILCEYWDLQANTDNVIINLEFKSVYNPQFLLDVDKAVDVIEDIVQAGSDHLADRQTTIEDTITVDVVLSSIYVSEDGALMAVGSDGKASSLAINADANEQTLITDASGEEYVINSEGQVMGKTEYFATSGGGTGSGDSRRMEEYKDEKENNEQAENTTVTFTENTGQAYGFDAYDENKSALQNDYQLLKADYRVAYKSLESFRTDKVIYQNLNSELQNPNSKLTFKDELGIPATTQGDELTLRGSVDGSELALYAYEQVNDSTELIAGKLNLVSYQKEEKRLHIIPVNGATVPTDNTLQKELNAIYKQAVAGWSVTTAEPLSITFADGKFTHGGSSAISVYNTDQKALIKAYQDAGNSIDNDVLYLFYIDEVDKSGEVVAGYMPLNYNVGFIYGNPTINTVAHELGHGAFNLWHTFSSEQFIAAEGKTDNLMDYSGGSELWKYQWDLIHEPQNLMFAWGVDEEEAEVQLLPDLVCTQKFIEQFRWAYVNKKKLEYKADAYPWFGHYANKILLDGNSYKQIYVTVKEDLGFIPTKRDYKEVAGVARYSYGSVLTIETSDKYTETSNYLFPTREQWDRQINDIVAKVTTDMPLNDLLGILAILPKTEFNRLSAAQIKTSIAKLAGKRLLMEDKTSCINDEEIILNIVNSCEGNIDKQRELISALKVSNRMNKFMFHLDGQNMKTFIFKVSKYYSNVETPNLAEIHRQYFNFKGEIYTKVFDWQDAIGPNTIFESKNAKSLGEFKISTKNDFLAMFQDGEYLMSLKPFEYVSLSADKGLKYLPADYQTGSSVILMPAFMLHYVLGEKQFEQTLDDIATLTDIGLTVFTLGTYAAGKTIIVLGTKSLGGAVVDLGIQAFLETLDGTPWSNAVDSVDYSNVVWSAASIHLSSTKTTVALECLRNGIKGTLSADNDGVIDALKNGGEECFEKAIISLISGGLVKGGDKLYEIIVRKLTIAPEFVTRRLLDYGLNKDMINSFKTGIVGGEIQRRIDNEVKAYEQEEKQ